MELVDALIKEGWLKRPEIIKAFRKIKRKDFLPEDIKDLADLNEALSIGWGQTISQPLVVAFMLETLVPKQGENILDIGAGSGWTSALLSEIVGKKGMVTAVELIPQLKEFGQKNIAKYGFIKKGNLRFVLGDGSEGYQLGAPFDKILASAAAQKEIPNVWLEQVKIGGRIVAPCGSAIRLLVKKSETEFEKTDYPGFSFVPLIEK